MWLAQPFRRTSGMARALSGRALKPDTGNGRPDFTGFASRA